MTKLRPTLPRYVQFPSVIPEASQRIVILSSRHRAVPSICGRTDSEQEDDLNHSRKGYVVDQDRKWPTVAEAQDLKLKTVICIVQNDYAMNETD